MELWYRGGTCGEGGGGSKLSPFLNANFSKAASKANTGIFLKKTRKQGQGNQRQSMDLGLFRDIFGFGDNKVWVKFQF